MCDLQELFFTAAMRFLGLNKLSLGLLFLRREGKGERKKLKTMTHSRTSVGDVQEGGADNFCGSLSQDTQKNVGKESTLAELQ